MKSYDIEIDFVNWIVYEKNNDNERCREKENETHVDTVTSTFKNIKLCNEN